MWQQQGLNLNGVVWFRREVTIPAALRGKDLLLHFGPIDDFDTTWLNGTKVGGMGKETAQSYATPRRYDVPAATVQAGANTLTVRVVDNYGNGGFAGLARDMYLTAADDPAGVRVDLSGVWHYKVESVLQTKKPEVPVGPEDPNSPAGLYHGRICPLASYALRGVIWYQGESNAGRAHEYRDLMKALIYDWRAAWRQPQLDFYQVQLANFMERSERPRDSQWAELREAQAAAARETPGCGLAVIIDVGEANDIHPRNKQDVGKRLALQALHTTYNRDIVCAGPTFRTVAFNGNEATIAFDNIGGGLVTRDNEPLVGFAIAGADRKFVWAQARIDGDTVLVWNDAIGTPVAVRYAWGDNPACNLYNREGLPAMPFRTDDWQPGDVKR
jgi:sialate O-acetylesterase